MNPLDFTQAKFLHGEENIMKSVSEPLFKSITRNDDYSYLDYTKKKIENESHIFLGTTVLELSKLIMYEFYLNILLTSLKNLQLH